MGTVPTALSSVSAAWGTTISVVPVATSGCAGGAGAALKLLESVAEVSTVVDAVGDSATRSQATAVPATAGAATAVRSVSGVGGALRGRGDAVRRGASIVGANITPMKTRNAPVASTQSRRGPVAIRESSVSGYGVGSGISVTTLDSIHEGTVSFAVDINRSGRSPFGIRFSCARTRRSSSRSSPRPMSARNWL